MPTALSFTLNPDCDVGMPDSGVADVDRWHPWLRWRFGCHCSAASVAMGTTGSKLAAVGVGAGDSDECSTWAAALSAFGWPSLLSPFTSKSARLEHMGATVAVVSWGSTRTATMHHRA